MSVRVDLSGLERMASASETRARQEEYAMRCAFVMRKYVPMRDGVLRASEPLNSDYDAGKLTWATPYAARHYYVPMAHTTAGTTDHWDEACRRNDMPALKKYVEAMYGRY